MPSPRSGRALRAALVPCALVTLPALAGTLVGNPTDELVPGELAVVTFVDLPGGSAVVQPCDAGKSPVTVPVGQSPDAPAGFIAPEGEWCGATVTWSGIHVIDGQTAAGHPASLRLDVPTTTIWFGTSLVAGPGGAAVDVYAVPGGANVLDQPPTGSLWVDGLHPDHDKFAAAFADAWSRW